MSNKIVSQTYFDAWERIHKATDMLYESLHNEKGTEAIVEYNEVLSNIKAFREWANNEIDLIREMAKESDIHAY